MFLMELLWRLLTNAIGLFVYTYVRVEGSTVVDKFEDVALQLLFRFHGIKIIEFEYKNKITLNRCIKARR